MANNKSKRGKIRSAEESATDASGPGAALAQSSPPQPRLAWNSMQRRLATGLILAYLVIVLLGPLSNPVASRHLSAPLSARVAPIQRALFLGHGYRFFGPDPGASHLVVYQGVRKDGTEFAGQFPDRETLWPRLLYHRWFMLSETLYSENALRPTDQQFAERLKQYDREIQEATESGDLNWKKQLARERRLEMRAFENISRRVDVLGAAIAKTLLERHDGQSIELFVQERVIPFPEQVVGGLELNDPRFLMERFKIGEFDASGFHRFVPVAPPVDASTFKDPFELQPVRNPDPFGLEPIRDPESLRQPETLRQPESLRQPETLRQLEPLMKPEPTTSERVDR